MTTVVCKILVLKKKKKKDKRNMHKTAIFLSFLILRFLTIVTELHRPFNIILLLRLASFFKVLTFIT